jgi:hypothetical protein
MHSNSTATTSQNGLTVRSFGHDENTASRLGASR